MFASVLTANAAVAINAGNDTISRSQLDLRTNFTIVDKNHPVSDDGSLDTFKYYANNTNSFRFVIIDSANAVKWIGNQISCHGNRDWRQ
ncbi:MAG: hypothetical protein PHQ47_03580 [Candidatus Portnoybacteria bacterium]|nr:hypothetical protein [Candidatus Portnoybacteria bacterium]